MFPAVVRCCRNESISARTLNDAANSNDFSHWLYDS